MAKKKGSDENEGTGDEVLNNLQPEPQIITKDITPFVSKILKSHSKYETLYVDNHGGVYTSDTPEPIRGCATLYNNPHYKP